MSQIGAADSREASGKAAPTTAPQALRLRGLLRALAEGDVPFRDE